jgi:DNA mismatch repair ATPase MutS
MANAWPERQFSFYDAELGLTERIGAIVHRHQNLIEDSKGLSYVLRESIGLLGEKLQELPIEEVCRIADSVIKENQRLIEHFTFHKNPERIAMNEEILELRRDVARLIREQLAEGIERVTGMPRMAIDDKLNRALRLTMEDGEDRGQGHIGRLLRRAGVVSKEYNSGPKGKDRFLKPISLEEARNFANSLEIILEQGELGSQMEEFKRLSSAEISGNGQTLFPGVIFHRRGTDNGYLGDISYPLRNAITIGEFVLAQLDRLEAGVYTDRIRTAVEDFLGSDARAKLEQFAGAQEAGLNGNILRSRGDYTDNVIPQIAQTITAEHAEVVGAYQEALCQFEYLLTWANVYADCETPHCKADISDDSSAGLAINGSKNPTLVLALEDARRVVPNDIEFSRATSNSVCLSGANGGGKTHVLESVANNAGLAPHRGLRATADSVTTPSLGGLEYSVNASQHSETKSSFQNWVIYLISLLRDFTDGEAIVFPELVLLDEPGRGTDAKDAIPLIIGLMKFFQDRGVYFGFSTHFNELAKYTEIMDELGITASFNTMERETHRVVPGVGRSNGIALAEEAQWPEEITVTAREIAGQAEEPQISTARRILAETIESIDPIRLSERASVELGVHEVVRDVTYGIYNQVGENTRIFALHSPFRYDYADSNLSERSKEGFEGHTPCLRQDAAHAFCEEYSRPLTTEEKVARVSTLDLLRGEAGERLTGNMEQLVEAATLFTVNYQAKYRDPSQITENMTVGKEDRRSSLHRRMRDFEKRDGTIRNTIDKQIESCQGIVDSFGDAGIYPALEGSVAGIAIFLASDACGELQAFWEDVYTFEAASVSDHARTFLGGISKVYGAKLAAERGRRVYTSELWDQWNALCAKHEKAIAGLHNAILEVNFYSTVATTVEKENFCKPAIATDNTIAIRQAYNTGLEVRNRKRIEEHEEKTRELEEIPVEHRGEQMVEELQLVDIVPSDIGLSFETGAKIIGGSNGGGKTKLLSTVGTEVHRAQQIGFVAAESAELPIVSHVDFLISTALHEELSSSGTTEAQKIKAVIDAYEAAGCPRNAIIMLDEPGKGTSGEEAIPLLMALMRYCEERGAMLVFTTHFSNIYDYMARLTADSEIPHEVFHMNFFSEDGQRFVLQEGEGASEGIRVCEYMGLGEEVITTARFVERRIGELAA